MPKISICIPTYNNLPALKRCLESILGQDYTDYEIIITDDSTHDEVSQYISSLQHPKIFYYRNPSSLGSPENWNEAMRKSTGEYIKILHHDDQFTYPNSLQIFVELLEKNKNCDFAFTASRVLTDGSNELFKINQPTENFATSVSKNPEILLAGNLIGAPSAVIFKRDNTLRFDAKTIWLVDVDFYFEYIRKHGNVAYSSTDAITTYISKNQITSRVENDLSINIFEYFYLADKWNIKKISVSPAYNQFRKILKKFEINSVEEIKLAGYSGNLPMDVECLFKPDNNGKESLKNKIKKIFTKK